MSSEAESALNELPIELLELIVGLLGSWDQRVLSASPELAPPSLSMSVGSKSPLPSKRGSPRVSLGERPRSLGRSPSPLSRLALSSSSIPLSPCIFRIWAEPFLFDLRRVCSLWREVVDSLLKKVRALSLSEVLSSSVCRVSFDCLVTSLADAALLDWAQLRVLNLSHLGDWAVFLARQFNELPTVCPKLEKLSVCHLKRGVEADFFTLIVRRLLKLKELYLTETPLQTSCQALEIPLSLPRSLRLLELSYCDNSTPLAPRINFGLAVRQLRPDIMLSIVSGGHNYYGFCKALVLADAFNTRAPHLVAFMSKIRSILLQCIVDGRFDVFLEITKSMSISTKRFWSERLTAFSQTRELWPLLVESGLFTPPTLLQALFIEFFTVDILQQNVPSLLNMINQLIAKYKDIDASGFISPKLGLSLVGLVCKAKIPLNEALELLVHCKVFSLETPQESKATSSPAAGKSDNLSSSGRSSPTAIDVKRIRLRGSVDILNAPEVETLFVPLYFVISSDNFELMDLLVNLGADINVVDSKGRSLLYHFISWRNFDWITVLLDHKVVIDWDSLWLAFSRRVSMRPRFFTQLENRFIFDSTSDEKQKILDVLVRRCSLEVLLTPDRDGKHFIDIAASDHCVSLVTLITRPNSDQLYREEVLKTYCANFAKHLSQNGDLAFDAFEKLADCHVSLFSRGSLLHLPCLHLVLNSFNLSHFWTFSVAPKVIKYFVGFGFNINSQDERGKTALHWAYSTGKPKIIQLCLELHADETIRDASGALPSEDQRVVKKWQSVKSSGSFK